MNFLQFVSFRMLLVVSIVGIAGLIIGCAESALHYEAFFTSKKHGKQNISYEKFITSDSIEINRIIYKQSYTLYPELLNDNSKKEKFLDSINNNNYLTINLLTPFDIKNDFEIHDLDIKVFRKENEKFNKELELKSVFVNNLKQYYNPYDFRGKTFLDFDSVKIEKGKTVNNVLATAKYDLSGILDSIFVVETRMRLHIKQNSKIINRRDTVIQKNIISKQSSFRVH